MACHGVLGHGGCDVDKLVDVYGRYLDLVRGQSATPRTLFEFAFGTACTVQARDALHSDVIRVLCDRAECRMGNGVDAGDTSRCAVYSVNTIGVDSFRGTSATEGSTPVTGPNGGVSYGRGPNYERNLASRLKKKAAKRGEKLERAKCATASSERARVDGTLDTRPGFFSGADEAVRKELVETRARRLIQENRVAEARAKAAAARIEKQMKAGFYEKCADAEINFVEGQLSGKYSLCVPRRVAGWAKTIVTGESGSGTNSASSPKSKPVSSPTLSKSSPSPSSSISQEEKRLSNLVTELEAKIVKLENENKKMESKWRTSDRERKQFEKMYRGLATGISIQPPENIRYK